MHTSPEQFRDALADLDDAMRRLANVPLPEFASFFSAIHLIVRNFIRANIHLVKVERQRDQMVADRN